MGVRVALEVDVSLSSESNFFSDPSGDGSPGGLFVVTWRKLPAGTPLFVAIDLPDGRLLADGAVGWIRDGEGGLPGLGIALVGLSHEDSQRIAAFCRQRAPLSIDVAE
jgi:hypothetical protein